MKIKIIKCPDNIIRLTAKGSFILEESTSNIPDKSEIKYKLYDSGHNLVSEICPKMPKTDLIGVYEASGFDDFVHFVSISEEDLSEIRFDIFRYNIPSGRAEIILSLSEYESVFSGDRKIKVFILSPSHVLVQYEDLSDAPTEDMLGHIIFSQKLYDLENGEVTDTEVEDFINNGINRICPLPDNKVVIKTGYSYLEDERYSARSKEEAVIESIFVVNVSRLISDLALKIPSIDMQLVYSAYFDKYILSPECSGNYIYFDVIDPDKNESESIFFNYVNGKTFSCKDINAYSQISDTKFIMNDSPYVLRRSKNRSEFLNLITQEFDIMFKDENFEDSDGRIMITSSSGKDGRKKLNIYRLPKLDFVADVKGEYLGRCMCEEVNYIYFRGALKK